MNRNVLFTGAVLAAGIVYLAMALRMPLGSVAFPGPGFYPSAVGVFLVLAAAVCFGMALVQAKKERPAAAMPERSEPGRPCIAPTIPLIALMMLYAVSLPYLGFIPAISAFLLIAMRIFGHRSWGRGMLITCVVVAVSYIGFVYWLNVPLPRGLLDEYL